jgi:hypothetical protein
VFGAFTGLPMCVGLSGYGYIVSYRIGVRYQETELEACRKDTAARRAQAESDGMSPGRLMEAPILVLPFAFCKCKPCVLLPTGLENAVLAVGGHGAQMVVKREDAKRAALAALQAGGIESHARLAGV